MHNLRTPETDQCPRCAHSPLSPLFYGSLLSAWLFFAFLFLFLDLRADLLATREPTTTPPLQALNHPYFFALPYPTHPSKLPKTAAQTAAASSRPLDEVDGNVDLSAAGPGFKAVPPKKLKRKLSGPDLSRNIARKLDFTAT
jgi:hypothetical protein